VSAGHCFDAGPNRENNVSCGGAKVYFGYRDGMNPSVSECQTVLAMQKGNGKDYAIYRVSPVPPVAVPVDLNARPGEGTRLTIFSHPQGRRLEWSQICSVTNRTGSYEFQYECDTEGGSSGAAVLSEDSLRVVGLHWGRYGSRNIANNLGDTPLAEFLNPGSANGERRRLVSRQSGKCLDVSGAGTANGTNIHLWECNGTDAQSFRVEQLGGGNMRFVNVGSNKCVDVSGASHDNGANIHLWDCNGTGAQSFWATDTGGGYRALVNSSSGKALDVAAWGTANGSNIQQWDHSWGDNQSWRIE
jgi:hypothetical protein